MTEVTEEKKEAPEIEEKKEVAPEPEIKKEEAKESTTPTSEEKKEEAATSAVEEKKEKAPKAEKKSPAEPKKKVKLPSGRHLSAIKRHRQSVKRAERNQDRKSELKTSIKKVYKAVEAKDATAAQTQLRKTISLLHKAGQKKVIHPRNASRRVGRLSKLVHGISV